MIESFIDCHLLEEEVLAVKNKTILCETASALASPFAQNEKS